VLRPGGCGAVARAAGTIVSVCAALVALAPADAFGRDVIGRSEVDLAWSRAAGEVGAYVVFVSRDGGPFRSEQYTAEPRVRVAAGNGQHASRQRNPIPLLEHGRRPIEQRRHGLRGSQQVCRER